MQHWHLARSTYGEFRDATPEVAVLPLGATEPHNLHLPYGTDTLEGDVIGAEACAAAARRGAKVVLLPTIPFGCETNMRELPLALNLNPSTLMLVVRDMIDSVAAGGIRKLVLLNMHGGNELKSVIRELGGRAGVHLFVCNWWEVLGDRYDEIFDEAEDHAGELETSIALSRFPELVVRNDDGSLRADDGATRDSRFDAVREGWVRISRPWHLLTTNTGSGDPHGATAEKGERAMEILVDRISAFLVDLAEAEIDGDFPFGD